MSALPGFFPGTVASADFSQFVVTTHFFQYVYFNAPVRPHRVRTKSFPPFICHIYRRTIPGSFWTLALLAVLSLLTALYVVSVRQTRGLPTPSFRFHLTMDTLGVQLYPSRYRASSGLSPFRFRPCRAHKRKASVLTAFQML